MKFAKYAGPLTLNQTSIDDIPMDEQRAYFASRGWEYDLEPFISDEQDDELYAAWADAQAKYGVPA